MRRAIYAVIALITTAALAQEAPPPAPQPDYSQKRLTEILSSNVEPPPRQSNVEFEVGAVSFRALGTRWRFIYLPIMMPLSGTRLGASMNEWPDPFSLTGTPIATPMRSWRTQRAMNAERKRIETITRIKVEPSQ